MFASAQRQSQHLPSLSGFRPAQHLTAAAAAKPSGLRLGRVQSRVVTTAAAAAAGDPAPPAQEAGFKERWQGAPCPLALWTAAAARGAAGLMGWVDDFKLLLWSVQA